MIKSIKDYTDWCKENGLKAGRATTLITYCNKFPERLEAVC